MPRPSRGGEGFVGGGCKIRKRGCSSSSSSSTVLQNYRLKRAVLVSRRGGASTPVPSWKLDAGSRASTAALSEFSQNPPSHIGSKAKNAPVSARKLATALWELNEIPPPVVKENLQERRYKEVKRSYRIARSIHSGSLPPHLSDPSHSPVSDGMDRSWSSGNRRRIPQLICQKSRFNEFNHRDLDFLSNGSLVEVETRSRGCALTPRSSVGRSKSRHKNLISSLNTSKELLKILSHIGGLEEQHSSCVSIISALRVEMDRACVQVDRLVEEQRSDGSEINYLKKRFMEEKSAWKIKEQGRIEAAVQSILEELELQKKSRRRTDRLNKKLAIELAEVKSALSKANKELENERKSREVIEQVCDELVKGIGEEKAEVKEMKRESAKVREELEKEREMLQLADIWREERVQMKLSEAKFQLEEKNAAVDQLKNELEAFLAGKRSRENSVGYKNQAMEEKAEDQEQLINQNKRLMSTGVDTTLPNKDGVEGGEVVAEDDSEADSVDSDLHSIELNMDCNSKCYKWSFATGDVQQGGKLASAEADSKRRISNPEKPSRNSFSLDRGISAGSEWKLCSRTLQDLGNGLDFGNLIDGNNFALKHSEKLDPEAERYKSVKGLRDQMLAGSKITSAQGLPSPTRLWIQPQPLLGSSEQVFGRSKVSEILKSVGGNVSKARGGKGENPIHRHKHLQLALEQ